MEKNRQLALRVAEFFGNESWIYPIVLVAAATLAYLIVRFLAIPLIQRGIERTPSQWDNLIAKRGVLNLAALLAPAIVVYVGVAHYPEFLGLGRRTILALMFLILTLLIGRLLYAVLDIYNLYPTEAILSSATTQLTENSTNTFEVTVTGNGDANYKYYFIEPFTATYNLFISGSGR